MTKILSIIVCAYLSSLFPSIALASGIQVSPTKLQFRTVSQQTQTAHLAVANPSGNVQAFLIYAEDFPSAITSEPYDFSLEPGGHRDIIVTVDTGKLPKSITTELDIVARPLGNGKALSVAAGVKVPITVTRVYQPNISSKRPAAILLILAVAVLLILGLIAVIWRLKRPRAC